MVLLLTAVLIVFYRKVQAGYFWDNGKENRNYYLGFRVEVLAVQTG